MSVPDPENPRESDCMRDEPYAILASHTGGRKVVVRSVFKFGKDVFLN
jgi:hypothetical protein